MKTRVLFFGACAMGLGLVGCPGPGDSPDAFVGADSGPPVDTGPGRDAGHDTGPSTPDMGMDGGRDAGTDGGNDAGMPDAFVGPDAFDPTCGTTCSDGNVCNGTETCDATTGTCAAGIPLVCDDGMSCTVDTCDPAGGCSNVAPDTDSDGDNDCSDCAPTDPARHHGATEVCNDIDDDCDLAIDEGTTTERYADCDGDGFAAIGAPIATGCTAPPVSDTGCGTAAEAWTATAPSDTDWDCADDEPLANSHETMFETTPIASAPDPAFAYDYNCDFVETPQFPSQGSCVMGSSCVLTMGWVSATIPDCGVADAFITACDASCAPTTMSRTQGCL